VSKPRPVAARARDSARPREASGRGPPEDSSRERIHQSALKLFSRYGYDGVSLQMIADDVGLHKSSLFHHYSGKLELMTGAVRAVITRLLEILKPLLAQEDPSLETLFEGVLRLVEHFSEAPDSARLLVTIMTAPRDSELAKLAENEHSLNFYLQLSRWLERARRHGIIRRTSIRQAIPNLMGVVLFYPAVANDLRELVGPDAFGPRARQIRKDEVIRLVRAMFAP